MFDTVSVVVTLSKIAVTHYRQDDYNKSDKSNLLLSPLPQSLTLSSPLAFVTVAICKSAIREGVTNIPAETLALALLEK